MDPVYVTAFRNCHVDVAAFERERRMLIAKQQQQQQQQQPRTMTAKKPQTGTKAVASHTKGTAAISTTGATVETKGSVAVQPTTGAKPATAAAIIAPGNKSTEPQSNDAAETTEPKPADATIKITTESAADASRTIPTEISTRKDSGGEGK
jgi:hypothetical protein